MEETWQYLVRELCGAEMLVAVSDYKAKRKKAVSLSVTATVSLGGKG